MYGEPIGRSEAENIARELVAGERYERERAIEGVTDYARTIASRVSELEHAIERVRAILDEQGGTP